MFRTGGYGPYMYSINGIAYQSSPLFTGLAAGSYTGYVKDVQTCLGMLMNILVGPESCGPIPPLYSTKGVSIITGVSNASLHVGAYPNPSVKDFTLELEGFKSNELITVNVTDMLGRIVYETSSPSKLQFKFGSNFIAGIYIVQVVQGNERKSIKLVKE